MPGGSAKRVRVQVFGKTDLGRTREHNEDCFLVADLTRRSASLQPAVREHEIGERGSLFVVADGMGGAAAGELASDMATQAIYKHLATTWLGDAEQTAQRFAFRLREAVEAANTELHAYARTHPEVRGMGTTTTAAGVLGEHAYLSQVGDSRGYLVRDGIAHQLTKDQSLMQRLVEAGELTEEEAAQSERRNIILQALGPDPRVKVDLTHQELRRGDTLVLCSDGLSGQVKKEEIAAAVTGAASLQAACERLIALANERGGPDNITVIVARFDGDGLRAADGEDPVGHQVYPLIDTEASTDPVPVYRGSRPPVPSRQSGGAPGTGTGGTGGAGAAAVEVHVGGIRRPLWWLGAIAAGALALWLLLRSRG
jgi:protein phosphatase